MEAEVKEAEFDQFVKWSWGINNENEGKMLPLL